MAALQRKDVLKEGGARGYRTRADEAQSRGELAHSCDPLL